MPLRLPWPFSRLAPFLFPLLLLLTGVMAVSGSGPLLRGAEPPSDPGLRQLQELREYAAHTGHLDPHVVHGHEAEDGGVLPPGYGALGPSHVGKCW